MLISACCKSTTCTWQILLNEWINTWIMNKWIQFSTEKWNSKTHFPIRTSLRLRTLSPRSEWNLPSDKKSSERQPSPHSNRNISEAKALSPPQTGASWRQSCVFPTSDWKPTARYAHILQGNPSQKVILPIINRFCWWAQKDSFHVLLMSIFNVLILNVLRIHKCKEAKKRKKKKTGKERARCG